MTGFDFFQAFDLQAQTGEEISDLFGSRGRSRYFFSQFREIFMPCDFGAKVREDESFCRCDLVFVGLMTGG